MLIQPRVWHPSTLARFGLITAIFLLAACATPSTSGATGTPSATVASPTATKTATAAPTSTATTAPVSTPTAASGLTGYPVKVYFSKAPDSLNTLNAVFPVNRVSPTSAVATFSIQLLIAGPTLSERNAGYFSELNGLFTGGSQCGGSHVPTLAGPDFTLALNVRGTKPQQGTATMKFCRPTASPGIGTDARVLAEITQTLRQFSTIKQVVVLNAQGNCFGDESGQNQCLK